MRDLAKVVGQRHVSVNELDLATYGRDMWPRLLLAIQRGEPTPYRPTVVTWPANRREVAAIVRLAHAHRVPIVPYGGGSGVCGGAVPIRGGITIDLKRMDDVRNIDRDELVCDVGAGINGERFERALNRRGYTLGHFPSSIYCSTVGGWLATRAAGQMSTKYGKIEDRALGLTIVTGNGETIRTDGLARAYRGPNWTQLFLGSEGTLGIITSARLRIAPTPAVRILRGFRTDTVQHGVEAIRRVMQLGLRPAVVRLYDTLDTFVHSLGGHSDQDTDDTHADPRPQSRALPQLDAPHAESTASAWQRLRGEPVRRAKHLFSAVKSNAIEIALSRPKLLNRITGTLLEHLDRGCLLIVGLEGARIRTEVEARLTFGELERAGCKDLGEEPGRHWLARRYAVSYKMSPTFVSGAFVDTMEVASSWERLMDLYHGVREAISRHGLVMSHFSHAYPDGCSIYFTFAGRASDHRSERIYDAIWRDGLDAALRAGGTISHHHGVGVLKAPYMGREHREAMAILRALKRTADPKGIMNPGKLGLGD